MRLKQNKKVFFSDIVHCYLNDKGEELIGVTSLMKKHGLGADYSGIPQDVLERAAERGSRVHRLLEDYDNGKAVEDCPILQSYKGLNLQVAASEYLISDNKTVASSIDKVLEDCSLVDIKTTSELHIKALEWQLSIYAYLFERQNKGLKVPHLYALHIRDARCRPLREINRLPDEEVARLIECERKGILYTAVPSTVPALTEIWPEAQIAEVERLEEAVAVFEARAKENKEKLEQYRARLYEYMLEHNIDRMETDSFSYTLKRPYEKVAFDTARFKEEEPQMYDQYTKLTQVKGNVIYKQK